MREVAATAVLSGLVAEVRPLINRFQAEKRRTARLDFDDLIFAARELLRDHEAVRKALGQRLVDYVIAHELIHLRERHHGPAFWEALSQAMPDWRKRKDALAEQAKEYLIFGLSV